jgi:hypothetical protein
MSNELFDCLHRIEILEDRRAVEISKLERMKEDICKWLRDVWSPFFTIPVDIQFEPYDHEDYDEDYEPDARSFIIGSEISYKIIVDDCAEFFRHSLKDLTLNFDEIRHYVIE